MFGTDGSRGDGGDGGPGASGPDPGPAADPDPDPERPRHRRVTVHRTGPGNSLRRWWVARHPLRVAVTYLVVWVVRVSPSLAVRRWLLEAIGVSVGPGVSWGLEATPDVFWPDRIAVGADAVVGYDATLLCHEFLGEEYRVGEVVVGEGAMIGAGAVVLPGVHVGAGASVAANSLVTEDVPPGTTVAGVPARPMSEVGDDSRGGDGASTDGVDDAGRTGAPPRDAGNAADRAVDGDTTGRTADGTVTDRPPDGNGEVPASEDGPGDGDDDTGGRADGAREGPADPAED